MKRFLYLSIFLFSLMAASCTEEGVSPQKGDDDPITIPPKPPKP